MTTRDTTRTASIPRPSTASAPPTGIPFMRLAAVELRKQLDTRAGTWLLVAIALISGALIALSVVTSERGTLTWTSLVSSASVGQLTLLPLIGVMAATSEWSARTALTTFTLEPRRLRVTMAKVFSASGLGVLVSLVTIAMSALLNVVAILAFDADDSWSVDLAVVAGVALTVVLLVMQGVAFGLAFLSTPIAIVAYLALPSVWSILSLTIEAIREPAEWLDLNSMLATLSMGEMTADSWPKLLVALAVWIGIPMGIGLWRTARREP
ncbi:ABC transporter permease [Microcella daejeonensis]|uniref:ABC transporter permease n=1 Tax=Microcella daejeonensis TaxID=2994971 RepID=UPI00226F4FB9|nr:ABC transporter permease [Microcella daejeonensis]WAB83596.1 ABC transporter permease [Microcella daejeonensis]